MKCKCYKGIVIYIFFDLVWLQCTSIYCNLIIKKSIFIDTLNSFLCLFVCFGFFYVLRSRLGCQICLTKALDGIVVKVPDSVADIRQSQDGSS